MKVERIILIATMVALCGCGTQKLAQNLTPTPAPTPERAPVVLYSQSVPDKIQLPSTSQVDIQEAPVVVQKTPKSPIPQTKTFTTAQQQHVRLPDANRLPLNGELVIDLEQLQGEFCYPYRGKEISAYGIRSGRMHTGLDIKAVPGDTIRAAMAGVVRMSKLYSAYGNVIVVQHPCGLETVYSHNAKNLVLPNDVVRAGQPIALAGRTGRASTEHLHFEVRAQGEHFDPTKLVNPDKMALNAGTLRINGTNGTVVARLESAEILYAEPRLESQSNVQYSSVNIAPQAKLEAKPVAKPAPKPAAKPAIHSVAKGDTLSSIARKYTTTVTALCKLNKIDKDAILPLGKKIKLR